MSEIWIARIMLVIVLFFGIWIIDAKSRTEQIILGILQLIVVLILIATFHKEELMNIEMFRLFCLAVMIFGWIWNKKQWRRIWIFDGQQTIVLGYLLLAIVFSSLLVGLMFLILIVITHALRDSRPSYSTGDWEKFTIATGTVVLVFPNTITITLFLTCFAWELVEMGLSYQHYRRVFSDKVAELIAKDAQIDSGM